MPIYLPNTSVGYQIMGAYFVLAGYIIKSSIPQIKNSFSAMLRRESNAESDELLPFSVAAIGLVACFIFAVAWLAFAGMSVWFAAFVMFIYLFVVALVLSRSVAEAGMLMTETSFRPIDVYKMFAGASSLGHSNLTVLGMIDSAFFRDIRGVLLTGILDGLKLGDGLRFKRRSFLPIFVVSVIVAMVVGGAFQLWLPYNTVGGGNNLYYYVYKANNIWCLQDYEPAMRGATYPVGNLERASFLIGAVITMGLISMRHAWHWWPFHPIGYALCGSWTMTVFWFSCFAAWILKSIVVKYGGMKMYMRIRPFFLGLALGEFSAAVVWAFIAWAAKVPAPSFPWP